jgi:hypothetical protein
VSNTDQPAVQPERTWTHTGQEPEPVAATPAAPAQPPYVYPPARPTSGMAITAFVLSLFLGMLIWNEIAALIDAYRPQPEAFQEGEGK